jgi:hypothetical protein
MSPELEIAALKQNVSMTGVHGFVSSLFYFVLFCILTFKIFTSNFVEFLCHTIDLLVYNQLFFKFNF